MVRKSTIARRKNERWDGRWFRDNPNRGVLGLAACFECKSWTPHTQTICAYGNCIEDWCDTCRRFSSGMGPVGCPCDYYGNTSGGKGHNTRDEQMGPHYRLLPNPDEDSYEPFVIIPFKKRKPSKNHR